MSASRLDRVEELFHGALELEPCERRAYVEGQCAGDADLLKEVEELLAALEPSGAYFDDLASAIAVGADMEIDHAVTPNLEVGAYRALRLIGHGGMGAVYLAERTDGGFDQQVALKLLHLDMQHASMRARFLAERQLLARLSHPHIARLLDGGLSEEGRPYFVMEYVAGQRITDFCRGRSLGIEEILRLFLELVEAVGYLHQNLVVHRDLKPSNILVDEEGHVRLLDFGIAKLLGGDVGADLTRTLTSERLLTPAYAAPEQAGDGIVTTATDVFSLGAVLYELLTGHRAFEVGADGRSSPSGAPLSPSARIRRDSISSGSGNEAGKRWRLGSKELAGDLGTICLMAMRPEPERRYASADRLGEDIEAYLRGLPVRARKNTLGYRFGKWLARHRIEAVSAIVLASLLAFGFAREHSLRGIAVEARSEAQEEAARAVAVSDFLGELLSSVDPRQAQGRDVSVAEVLDTAAERLQGEHSLSGHGAAEAEVRLTLGRTYTSLGKWEEARAQLERALEIRLSLADELARLEVVEALGILAYRSRRLGDAEEPLLEVLGGRSELLGEEHRDTLGTMGHLANLYWYQDRLDEAEQLDRKTLAVRQRVLGDDHPDSLRAKNGLATTLFARAQFTEAAEFFAEALEGQKRILGDDHPDTLQTKNNLAASYSAIGRYREAEPLQWDVAQGRAQVLGAGAGPTTTSWHNLGLTLYRLGRYEEAEVQLLKARDLRRQSGSTSAWLFSQSFLADLYRDMGRLETATTLYLETLEKQREALGAENHETLRTEIGLAELELRRGDWSSAESRIIRVLELQAVDLEAGHPDWLAARSILCSIRLREGRVDEALTLAEEAIDAGELSHGSEYPAVEVLRLQQARVWLAQGQLEAARNSIASIAAARQKRLGAEHPSTREAEDLLAGS